MKKRVLKKAQTGLQEDSKKKVNNAGSTMLKVIPKNSKPLPKIEMGKTPINKEKITSPTLDSLRKKFTNYKKGGIIKKKK
jgi:hypothetical protein